MVIDIQEVVLKINVQLCKKNESALKKATAFKRKFYSIRSTIICYLFMKLFIDGHPKLTIKKGNLDLDLVFYFLNFSANSYAPQYKVNSYQHKFLFIDISLNNVYHTEDTVVIKDKYIYILTYDPSFYDYK
jgi:hypothetical protein